ncbi:MAG TPA: hypothetical protein DCE41_05540 [Cytophagales bacterium]|nr:hypothetical protein [Cytophagales bacterium]HAA18662.1 hypothetical protein [Cytophagales bacterium]HAP62263.1 hypothetical protein [Cytophagales bacterium]
MNPKVDQYIALGCGRCPLYETPECKVHAWTEVLEQVRGVLLETDLTEELKWGAPCYTYQGANVLMMAALKNRVTVGFFKGVLLKDPGKALVAAGANSHHERQLRYTEVDQVAAQADLLRAYVAEAIEIEQKGLKVEKPTQAREPIPEELQAKFVEDPALKSAFEALTPGRQRGYILHFSQPKQAKTRTSRIEKLIPKIMAGKGFHDR